MDDNEWPSLLRWENKIRFPFSSVFTMTCFHRAKHGHLIKRSVIKYGISFNVSRMLDFIRL